jgi:predicted lipid-binding transport protein (Tim44 family)
VKKVLFATLLGGVLGVFDGLSALLSAPETRPEIVSIVIGSTFKGLIVGVLIGMFAKKERSLTAVLIFGVLVSAFFAYLVAAMQGKYYLEIIAPGALVGLIVGYATQKYQADSPAVRGSASPASRF